LLVQRRRIKMARKVQQTESTHEAPKVRGRGPGIIMRRMPVILPIAVPAVAYAFVVWFLLARFGWEVALAVGLAMPIILVPPALVWYIGFLGTYQVIREGRARQMRRSELLREVEAILRNGAAVNLDTAEAATDFWANKTPCWELNNCPPEIRDECPAYRNRALPCWEIEGTYSKLCMGKGQANGRDTTICQACPIYKKYGEGAPIRLKAVQTATEVYARAPR
jgi:hypothetical protein